MAVAFISDIHGNVSALEAVLADCRRLGINDFVCLGDVASIGAHPRETLDLVRELQCPVIMGNTDAEVLHPRQADASASDILKCKLAAEQWCSEQLTEADKAFIRSFRASYTFRHEDTEILCFHASPHNDTDFIRDTTDEASLDRYFSGYSAQVFMGGHSHIPFLRRYRQSWFANPGSVGMPYQTLADGSEARPAWAEYAILDVTHGQPNLSFRRAPYDVAQMVKRVRATDMPCPDVLLDGWLKRQLVK